MRRVSRKSAKAEDKEIMMEVQKIFIEKGGAILEEATREILEEEIESEDIRKALAYHADRWRDLTRPALIVLACEAVGGKPEIVTPIAKAMILTSGAIDLHDDIIDQSTTKRSHPTLLGKFGADVTLLTADALLFKGLSLMYEMIKYGVSSEKASMVIRTIRKLLFELGDGEALELRLRRRIDVDPEEYLRVVRKKAADMEGYMRIGAILGNGDDEKVEALGEYGRILGMMVILRDDLEDMLDFEGEMLHRIKNEVLPLPVLYALKKPEVKTSIASIMEKKKVGKEDAEAVFTLTDEAGGLKDLGLFLRELARTGIDLLGGIKYRGRVLESIIKATVPPL